MAEDKWLLTPADGEIDEDDGLTKEEILDMLASETGKIAVDLNALKRVINALNGPGHLIRELQATRGPLVGDDNPINVLAEGIGE